MLQRLEGAGIALPLRTYHVVFLINAKQQPTRILPMKVGLVAQRREVLTDLLEVKVLLRTLEFEPFELVRTL